MLTPDPGIIKEYGLTIFLVVFLVGLFTYLLKTIIKQWTDQSALFTTVIQNHLSHSTQAMNDTCKILTEMKIEVTKGFDDSNEAHRKERTEHDEILREIKSK